jgi:hypothetical protein
MTQVDLGLTSVGRFDSADSVISVNDGNYKPGASHICALFLFIYVVGTYII